MDGYVRYHCRLKLLHHYHIFSYCSLSIRVSIHHKRHPGPRLHPDILGIALFHLSCFFSSYVKLRWLLHQLGYCFEKRMLLHFFHRKMCSFCIVETHMNMQWTSCEENGLRSYETGILFHTDKNDLKVIFLSNISILLKHIFFLFTRCLMPTVILWGLKLKIEMLKV